MRPPLTILPYSLRAADEPAVATPVTWGEIEAALAAQRPDSLRFSPGQVLERSGRLGDPMPYWRREPATPRS